MERKREIEREGEREKERDRGRERGGERERDNSEIAELSSSGQICLKKKLCQ